MDYKQIGRIIKITGGLYTVRLAHGPDPLAGSTVACRARGNFRHEGLTPLVGDVVTVSYDDGSFSADNDGTAIPDKNQRGLMIADISPRKNALIRPPLANLDIMLVVLAADKPAPDIPTVDKLLCILEYHHILPVVVIGKRELDPDRAAALTELYTSVGYQTFPLSCHTGEGLDAFVNFAHTTLPGKITGIAGASGVGKSTLLGKAFPHMKGLDGASPASGDISRKTARGKNTTRHTELFPLPAVQENRDAFGVADIEGVADASDTAPTGYIADTAGFSLLDFARFDFFALDDLPHTFPEFAPYLGHCRYTDCTHLCEEGCAIVDAVRAGVIPPSRHEAYRALYATLKDKHAWDK